MALGWQPDGSRGFAACVKDSLSDQDLDFSTEMGCWFVSITTRESGSFKVQVTSNFFASTRFPDGPWTDQSFAFFVGYLAVRDGQVRSRFFFETIPEFWMFIHRQFSGRLFRQIRQRQCSRQMHIRFMVPMSLMCPRGLLDLFARMVPTILHFQIRNG